MVQQLWQKLSAAERAVLACVPAECLFIAFVCVAPGDLASVAWTLLLASGPVSVWLWPSLLLYFRAQVEREQERQQAPLAVR